MTKENKIDRRKFLKVSTAGIFSSIVLNQMAPLLANISSSGRDVALTSGEFLKSIPTICDLCPAHCGVLGFIQNDFLAGIQGNPAHPNNNGKICARGIAGMNLVHDPQRLLYPLKRDGKRGQGHWKRISWNEALSEIRSHFSEMSEDDKFIFQCKDHHLTDYTANQLQQIGNPVFLSTEADKNANKRFAQKITFGNDSFIADVKNSRYILLFGANPFESHEDFINLSQRLIQAKIDNGAKIITIDPRLSNTAGKSDDWLPLKPGTDAIVALSMANVIIQEQLHDAEFINRWTNISVPSLKNYLAQFPVQKAAEESSMPEDKIREIAIEFATDKPAVAIPGNGISNHVNGLQNVRAVLLLNAVIGAIDIKGGLCLPRNTFDLDQPADSFVNSHDYFRSIAERKEKVHAYISFRANPAFEEPDYQKIIEVLGNTASIPYHIAITNVMSETAALADLILPTTIYPEQQRVEHKTSLDLQNYLAIAKPVVAAQGECKSIEEILNQLTGNRNQNFEDITKNLTSRVPRFSGRRHWMELQKNGIWMDPPEIAQYETYKNRGFNTPSRRFEIDSSYLRSKGLFSLPQYIANNEHIELKKDELILIPYATNVMTEDLGNSKWLAEISHGNAALINPRTARSLRLRHGSKVMIESTTGKLEMHVRITPAIHPDAIAIAKGFGHWEYGKVAQAKKFKSQDPDSELIWWEKLAHGENPNVLVEASADPVSGGQSWKDTKVTVKKV
ncbi:molybdopterin-dependent oxidoreductase [candidate division KSB1 bacterium]|nr:molybdopterin-dependent oxidoreductase [candidate division KSB1 bacterium]